MKCGAIIAAGMLLICAIALFGQTAGGKAPAQPAFAASDRCAACHNGLTAASGLDVSLATDWQSSMMANSARDPYWHAGVRREVTDHPSAQATIENECSICHIPMTSVEQRAAGLQTGVFSSLDAARNAMPQGLAAMDGVSCTVCHQVAAGNLGARESFSGGFAVDLKAPAGARPAYGPYDVDRGRTTLMQSSAGFVPSKSAHIAASELCATCHTLYTHALDESGRAIAEFPEQVPYLEWRHSGYGKSRSCQSCHMPKFENIAITSVLPQPRERLMQHVFRAGNFFIPQILVRYPDTLGQQATARDLNDSARLALEHLSTSTARISIGNIKVESGRLTADVSVRNTAGHKLPTAYPSRRAWIRFVVKDAQGETVFESGALRPDGSIAGNDNDADAGKYEPHYEEIDGSEKVQIYEPIMGDAAGRVTTGLLKGVRYLKDNRLLPMGFNKETAGADFAVHGSAREDKDFSGGGDRIRYSIPVKKGAGPFTVAAELWYQPIGFRWAMNLKQTKAKETDSFVSMFESMARSSAALLAQSEAKAEEGK